MAGALTVAIQPVAHVYAADPTSAVIDGPLIVYLDVVARDLLEREREASKNPDLDWPKGVAETMRVLHLLATNWRMSASGHGDRVVSREMSANGRAVSEPHQPADTMVSVKTVAKELGVTERQARRIALLHGGVKQAGAWQMSRSALEKARR